MHSCQQPLPHILERHAVMCLTVLVLGWHACVTHVQQRGSGRRWDLAASTLKR